MRFDPAVGSTRIPLDRGVSIFTSRYPAIAHSVMQLEIAHPNRSCEPVGFVTLALFEIVPWDGAICNTCG